jgi:hypothetical protein
MSTITEKWDGMGLPEKLFRVRWKTTDNKKRSGWLPNDYPSYSAIRESLLGKKIVIETENVDTGERFYSDEFNVSDVLKIKYLRLMSADGYAETAALGFAEEEKTTWVFHNNKYNIQEHVNG